MWFLVAALSLAVPTDESVAALVTAIESAPLDQAWSSVDVLTARAADARRGDVGVKKAARSILSLLKADGDPDRKLLAYVALRGLGEHAVESAPVLAERIRSRPLAPENVLAAIALAHIGPAASDSLEDLIALEKADEKVSWTDGKKITPYQLAASRSADALLALFAILELGTDAKGLKSDLLQHVENLPNIDSYILHPHCIAALEEMKVKSKSIEERLAFEDAYRRGGILPGEGRPAFAYLSHQLGLDTKYPDLERSLPDETPTLKRKGTAGALALDIGSHFIQTLSELDQDLPGRILSIDDLRKRCSPLVDQLTILELLREKANVSSVHEQR